MGAVAREPLRSVLPLAAVIAALEHAAELGELTPAELEWSLAHLSGRPRRGEAGDDRREEILRAATRVFLRRGYRHATVEEIAGELSLTKAGVYHYFVAKQEILDVICEAAMAASERVISEGLRRPGSPAERLERMAAQYADLVLSDPGLLVFVRHFDELSELMRAQIRKRRRRLAATLRQVIDQGVAEGVFEAPNSAIAVLGLFGSMNWSQSWYDPDGRIARGNMRDLLVGQVMRGVLAPAER